MIDLTIYRNFCDEKEPTFFLDIPEYKIVERFGLWGRDGSQHDPTITKLMRYHMTIDDDGEVISDKEGIEITWEGNPFNVDNGDYYKMIK